MQGSSQLRRNKSHYSPEICTSSQMRPRTFWEWIDYYQKNKPQTNALAAGLMVTLFGGQHIGWGIFNNHLTKQPWSGGYEDEGTVFWAITCWFLAAILGFFISSFAVNRYSKISIYMFASTLAGISATLFITFSDNICAIFPARILGGLSYGVTYPTLIVHASEVAVPRLRGLVISSVHLCLLVGIFTTSSSLLPVYSTRIYEVDPTQTIGVNGLVIVACGVVIAAFFNRESPVFLIKKYRDAEAVNIIIRLRSESHETPEIRRDFEEFQQMVVEDEKTSFNIFNRNNLKSLLLVMGLRILFVASFNMPLNLVFLEAVEEKFYDGMTDSSGMCLMGSRWGIILISMIFLDFRRLKIFQISAGISGLALVGVLVTLYTLGLGYDETTLITVLAFLFQVSSGLAVGIIPDIYSSDAFNTKKKALSIAFTSTIEFLLQVLLISSFYYLKISLYLIIGCSGALLMLGGYLAMKITDTTGLSLRNARNKFYL